MSRRWFAWAVVAAAMLQAGAAQAAWHRAETRHFVIYGEGSPELVQEYAEKLENFDGVLRMYHGLDPQAAVAHKLDIYLVDSMSDMRRVFPELGESSGGVYQASRWDIFAIARRDHDGMEDDVLLHEYVHHFMQQHFPYNYPRWLVEGWAEYFMTTDIDGPIVKVGGVSDSRLGTLDRDWLPLEILLGAKSLKGGQVYRFYAQSWLLTHYMLATPERRAQLDAYMRAVGAGGNPARSMETATGADLKTLERQLLRYVNGRPMMTQITRKALPQVEVSMTALPASADDILLENQRLKLKAEKWEGPQQLSRVRRLAARYPGDRLADLALARAEVRFGDVAAGRAILERYLEADGSDLDALLLKADSYLVAAKAQADEKAAADLRGKARALLGKAYAIDPDRYQTLFAYAEARSGEEGYPSENTLNTLLVAQQLAPQVDDIRLKTAEGLMLRARYDEARHMAMPLVNDPHGGEDSEAATKLLADIEARTSKGAPAATPAPPEAVLTPRP